MVYKGKKVNTKKHYKNHMNKYINHVSNVRIGKKKTE